LSIAGLVSLVTGTGENRLDRLEDVFLGSTTDFFPTSDLNSETINWN